jgi:transposase
MMRVTAEATDMTRNQRAAELRRQLATVERKGAGKPFPTELRKAVVAYAAQGLVEGESIDASARALGISAMSIKRWTKRLGQHRLACGAEMRRVEIVAEHQQRPPVDASSEIVVHTPHGLRIEGLSLAAVAQLVRTLG